VLAGSRRNGISQTHLVISNIQYLILISNGVTVCCIVIFIVSIKNDILQNAEKVAEKTRLVIIKGTDFDFFLFFFQFVFITEFKVD
jgi:hypothetical protein